MLPESIAVDVSAIQVAKAIVGHLLAAEERRDASAPVNSAPLLDGFRRFFLDDLTSVDTHRVYVWPYMGPNQVIIRGFALSTFPKRQDTHVFGSLMKFYPLAFLVTTEEIRHPAFRFAKLPVPYSTSRERIRIPLHLAPPTSWPERPFRNEVLIHHGRESSVATPLGQSEPDRGLPFEAADPDFKGGS